MDKSQYLLPALPYKFDALEPHIDAQTMEIHHGRHHATYVSNLNKALEQAKIDMHGKPIEEVLVDLDIFSDPSVRLVVRNNGGGHANHSMFWQIINPDGGGEPTGPLAEALKKTFGDYENFKKLFTAAALKRFGSGWAWLVYDGKGLQITDSPNQDNPLMQRQYPVMGLDVWEHAYYLHYQNNRASYINAFWNVVYWPEIAKRYQRALDKSWV